MRHITLIALLSSSLAACADHAGGGSPRTEDAATPDASLLDDGGGLVPDASPPDDAGTLDAGALDAGPEDGGSPPPDAAPECLDEDLPDDFGVDDDCDGAEGSLATSIYVSPQGDDVFAGSPTYPVKTLARALELHVASPSRVHVFVATSETPYDAEGLGELLTRGVGVHGSLEPELGWSRPAGPATPLGTTFRAGGNGVRAALSRPLATISYARLESRRGEDEIHSVVLSISGQGTLDLQYVELDADHGKSGAHGAPGDDGAAWFLWEGQQFVIIGNTSGNEMQPITTQCVGYDDRSITYGGTGGDGRVNSSSPKPGLPGGGGACGGAAGTNGNYDNRIGKPGCHGADGAAGDAAESHGESDWALVDGLIEWPLLAAATIGGLGRGGGGGGGGQHGGGCNDTYKHVGGGGAGGGGGCPGLPGTSGESGGFSVGLVVRGTWPSMKHVRVLTGDGGDGGNGALGGDGTAGREGGAGNIVSYSGCSYGGGRGGDGGDGGRGGDGASGAGGWSVAILTTTEPGDVSGVELAPGAAGTGGTPVMGDLEGVPGQSHAIYTP